MSVSGIRSPIRSIASTSTLSLIHIFPPSDRCKPIIEALLAYPDAGTEADHLEIFRGVAQICLLYTSDTLRGQAETEENEAYE